MSASDTRRRSPYQGLIPYDEADAPFFFGREKETRLIIANLFASPLTLLYGASGVGKSSALRAGVANQLRGRDELLVLVFNVWQSNPVADLKIKIAEKAGSLDPRFVPPTDSANLAEYLANCAEQLDRRLMIILDQFEEYFLYHPKEDEFATEFSRAVTQSGSPVSFLISIREDFYAKLDRFEGRIPTLYDNYLRIEHLDRRAARVAIESPIAEYNRHYTSNGKFSIEPDLVDAVLRQVETGRVILGEAGRGVVETAESTSGSARIETPFLQLVMTRLWEQEQSDGSRQLRSKTLKDLGGAENIVRTHLDAVITKLSDREQEIAASIFHYLVTPSGTKIAYTASDLASSAELEEDEVVGLLKRLSFGDVRILRTVEPSPDRPTSPRYEIFHDVLAPAILTWRTAYVQAQERAEAERRAEEQRADAERRANEQKQRADEQARVASRFRRLAIALAVVFVLALGAVVLAVAQTVRAKANEARADNYARESERLRQEGQRDKAVAQAERQRAEDQTKLAIKLKSDADAANAATEEQIKIAEQRKAEAEEAQGVARLKTLAAARANADANRATLEAAEQTRATRVGYSNLLAAQSNLAANQHPQRSLLLAIEALNQLEPGDPHAPAAEGALQKALSQTGGRVLRGHKGVVVDLFLSPDNRWLVSADDSPAHYLWDLNNSSATPIQLAGIPSAGSNLPIAFSKDGRWLAASRGNSGGTPLNDSVLLWDLNNPASAPRALSSDDASPVTRITFSADGRWLVTGTSYKGRETISQFTKAKVRLWNLTSANPTVQPVVLPGDVNFFAEMSADGRWLATINRDTNNVDGKVVQLWDLRSDDPSAKPVVLSGHSAAITQAISSPDSHWLATTSANSIRLWDLTATNPSSTPIVLATTIPDVAALVFAPDSKLLAVSDSPRKGADGTCLVWKLAELSKPPQERKVKGKLAGFVLVIDTYGLVVQREKEETFVHAIEQDERHDLRGGLISISPDSRSVVTMNVDWFSTAQGLRQVFAGSQNFDANLRLWNFSSEEALLAPIILRGHEGMTTSLVFSKDNRFMVTGGLDKTVRVWNITNPSAIFTTPLYVTNEIEESFAPNSRWLVTRGPDHTMKAWDLSSSDPTAAPIVLRGHKGKVVSGAVSPDSGWLATSSEDGTVRLWDMRAADPSANQKVLQGVMSSLVFSADNHWLAALTNDAKSIRLWDLTATDPQVNSKTWARSEGLTVGYRVYISPDRQWLLDFKSNRLSNLTAQNLRLDATEFQKADIVIMSPDNQWLVLNRRETLELWNLTDKNRTAHKLEGARSPLAFSPDNRWLFSDRDEKPGLWDLRMPEPKPLTLPGEFGPNRKGVVFSSDGKWLAVGGDEDTTLLWNLNDLEAKPVVLRGDNANLPVQDVDISADNRWLATFSLGNVNMWDLKARNPAAVSVVLPGSGLYEGIAFSRYDSKSKWLILRDKEETVFLWNLVPGNLVVQACRIAGRNLTVKEWDEYFPGQPYRKTCPDLPAPQ